MLEDSPIKDSKPASGRFAIGYYDRVAHAEQIVPFEAVILDPERPGMLAIQDETGFAVGVPLHRVRTVYKNGVVIWQRPRRPE